jgi:hypothetical protein
MAIGYMAEVRVNGRLLIGVGKTGQEAIDCLLDLACERLGGTAVLVCADMIQVWREDR